MTRDEIRQLVLGIQEKIVGLSKKIEIETKVLEFFADNFRGFNKEDHDMFLAELADVFGNEEIEDAVGGAYWQVERENWSRI